ncbi:hypothetical protein K435DRAFT_961898 [Dendrothele bispora CBS 962.96]|uniref:Uncharacterized protein n=1 Tax=Dendrothele bispora (strain CBS 962.96) TaxID=1314807 RepID=A0A4S8MQ57_DENBC|nr:hypothetical protein K435DRAFT_961898 [Dendrothele bispora CBS 962.96]
MLSMTNQASSAAPSLPCAELPSPQLATASTSTHEPLTHTESERWPLGYNFSLSQSSSSTNEPRYHSRLLLSDLEAQIVEQDVELGFAPPAYEESPMYTEKAELPTLAMYLFKFGFVFPPLWILGVFILLSPLRAPDIDSDESSSVWLLQKTEAERQAIIDHVRKVELEWAWRCFWSLFIFTLLVIAGAIAISLVLRE